MDELTNRLRRIVAWFRITHLLDGVPSPLATIRSSAVVEAEEILRQAR